MKIVIEELVRKGLLEKFLKKDGKKSWNIFRKYNKSDNTPDKSSKKKQRSRGFASYIRV